MATNLVIQTAFLGDVLLSIPLLKRIRTLSQEELALVVRKGFGEIFLKTGLVDRVFEITKGDRQSYDHVLGQLEKNEIHILLSPHESLRTHFFVSNIKAENKVGFKHWWNFPFFDVRIKKDLSLPDPIRQMSLLSASDPALEVLIKHYKRDKNAYKLGKDHLLSKPPTWASMSLREKLLENKSFWSRFLEKQQIRKEDKLVLIFPGSVWPTKKWKSSGFVELAKSLQERGDRIIWMGAKNEESLCQELSAKVPGSLCMAGKTSIYESAMLLARAHLAIGNDSASMHLASCAEAPLVSLFGPTVIEFGFRPWSEKAYLAQVSDLGCRPCGPHGHRQCPLGTHRCMQDLEARQVLEIIHQNNL